MVNRVTLLGRLGKDPEVINFEGGNTKANFPLATNEVYYDKKTSQKVEQTDWHNIVLWRRQAEIASQYLKKGDLVYIEGKIKTRSYDDKEGNKRYITEIVVDNFQMLSNKADSGSSGGSMGGNSSAAQPSQQAESTSPQGPADLPEQDDDDLPF